MAHCEYRLGNPTWGVKVEGVGSMGVAVSTDNPICRVKAEGGDVWNPVCDLPTEAGTSCPIAAFRRNEITLSETNRRLETIFIARKKA